jgi:hypothetical protein
MDEELANAPATLPSEDKVNQIAATSPGRLTVTSKK